MLPINKKIKTLSNSMTEFVGLVEKNTWDETNVFSIRSSSPSLAFDNQPVIKKSKLDECSNVTKNNIFVQQISQTPGKDEQIVSQYKKIEKSPTLIVNKHYHRQGLRERLAKKSLSFDQEWQRKEMLRREEHIIKRAEECLLNNKELTNTLCLEILDLSDETFHALLLSHPTISLHSVTILITTAWAKNAEGELQTDKKRKFASLAKLCILPKLLEHAEHLRSVLPSYQKLLAIDQDLVVENILLPFMQLSVPIPPPLLQGMKTHKLIRMTIDWLAVVDIKLQEGLLSNIQMLLENEQEYFEEPTGTKFLKVLQGAVRSQPNDFTLASLLLFVVKKFVHTLRSSQLKFLQSVNEENCTMLRSSVSKIIVERLRRDTIEPMDIS